MKYGICNAHYSKISNNTFQPPIPMLGAVSIAENQIVTTKSRKIIGMGEITTNILVNGCNVSLDICSLPLSFLTDILGYVYENGILSFYGFNGLNKFALLYETKDTGLNTRCTLYECTCAIPDIEIQTVGENITIKPYTLNIKAEKSIIKGKIKDEINSDQEQYADWFNGVI